LEKPVTEPKKPRVYPRNTKELTVSEAIEKFRESFREENAAIEKLRAEGVLKRNRILLRVPEVVRDHVATEGANPEPGPSPSADVQSDINDGIASDAASRLGPAGPVEPTERIERDEAGARRVGKGRA
jgi:hypothetical protein